MRSLLAVFVNEAIVRAARISFLVVKFPVRTESALIVNNLIEGEECSINSQNERYEYSFGPIVVLFYIQFT